MKDTCCYSTPVRSAHVPLLSHGGMQVCGAKWFHHTFPKGGVTIARDLVCDTPYPVVRVVGLFRYGYKVSSGYRRTTLMWRGHLRADVTANRGLDLLEPKLSTCVALACALRKTSHFLSRLESTNSAREATLCSPLQRPAM